MRVINQTKNTVLAEEAVVAASIFSRIIGLLGKSGLKKEEALILKPCNSVHTFFMRFSIDVLFIDKRYRIIRAISSLRPFHITSLYFKAALAIEMPAGIIQLSSTQEGDIVLISD